MGHQGSCARLWRALAAPERRRPLTGMYSTLPCNVPTKSPGVVLTFMGDTALNGAGATCCLRPAMSSCKRRLLGSKYLSPVYRLWNRSNAASFPCGRGRWHPQW